MVGPDRIDSWIDQLAAEQAGNVGEMSVEKAKNMLALCACIQTAATAFLLKHQMEGSNDAKST